MIKKSIWEGCYRASWNGILLPEAYSHPAKFAPGLISRILRHMLERGYIAAGDSVVDPFGGVGLGGLDAASFGLHWIGVELEQDFVILAHKNINQWMNKEWCNCGQESRAYLCSMREEVSKRAKRGQSEEGENGAILQPELQQQLSLFGQGTEQGAPGENEGAHTLERGQGTLGGNESENSGEGQAENRREESKLEGGADAQRGWVLGDPAKWSVQNGTRPHYGATYWTPPKSERGSSSQEWRQDGQPVRESSGDDSLGAYETPSPRGSCQQPATDHMRDLRQDVSGIAPPENVQRRVQAGKAARVSATIRRQEEGARCLVCGRLIAPPPIVMQGDSRRLSEIVGGGMAAAVSSPPYADGTIHGGSGIDETKYADKSKGRPEWSPNNNHKAMQDYGDSLGQLGSMKSGDFAAALSSPPYADAVNGSGEGPGARHDPIHHNGDNAYKQSSANGYGATPGNLGNMAGNGYAAAGSSPPYEASHMDISSNSLIGTSVNSGSYGTAKYGDSEGQLAETSGETFWSAARVIVEQTYQVLRPGGYAAWVTKRFVRNKQIVEFSEQWAQLCEAAGFVRVEWIRAMLTEEHGHQLDIFGDSHPKGIKRASFFRRLYEKKYPENAIDWEDVLIMRKPL